jgi:D-beta-D-heptose 7-phosphate kinase/D-beta-D-heptose 1-phosphate adenosyltransferase
VTAERARHLLARFSDTPVLVVGDVMLDRFIHGRVTRISPEAPVPVVRFNAEDMRLGGAANVAHNLANLGARVALIGVVGADASAHQLRSELTKAGIRHEGLIEDGSRRTVEKVRIVTDRHQQVARIDYEDDADLGTSSEGTVVAAIEAAVRDARVLLVSDYLKGTITPGVMRALLAHKNAGTPLLVDPKIPHLDRYAGATLITPNQHEAEAATHGRIRTDQEAREVGRAFRARAQCHSAIVTRGEQGMWVSSPEVEQNIEATSREVADVTGAGDTVMAMLALALASGASLLEAATMANHAAGIVVGKFGTGTVTRDEVLERF